MEKFDPTELVIRVMREEDLDAIVRIDAQILGDSRPDYYRRKCMMALDESSQMVMSLVAKYKEDVIGFIMGNLYIGEFGIPETSASIDTIGVLPEFQAQGVGLELLNQFMKHMGEALVENVYILVDWNDWEMLRFFEKSGFVPSKAVKLERQLK